MEGCQDLLIFVVYLGTLGGIFSHFIIFYFDARCYFFKRRLWCFPVILGIIFFIPTYTHESDAVPGLVNHLVGKFCRKILFLLIYKKYFPLKQKFINRNQ